MGVCVCSSAFEALNPYFTKYFGNYDKQVNYVTSKSRGKIRCVTKFVQARVLFYKSVILHLLPCSINSNPSFEFYVVGDPFEKGS